MGDRDCVSVLLVFDTELAMLGDAATSFLKRRLALPPSSRVLGFDQVPESALPLLALRETFTLNAWDIVVVTLAFVLLHTLLSPLLFRMRLRRQPY